MKRIKINNWDELIVRLNLTIKDKNEIIRFDMNEYSRFLFRINNKFKIENIYNENLHYFIR